jgi:hypothetical protein
VTRTSAFKLAGFSFSDPVAASAIDSDFRRAVANIFDEHGPRAFEQPRSAAIAHESSHAIVGTHDGLRVERVRIWSRPDPLNGGPLWGGLTDYVRRKRVAITPETPLPKVLSNICLIVAGEVGEFILDPGGYREASSLDEVVISQNIANLAATEVGIDPRVLWFFCRLRVAAIIEHNRTAAAELARLLDRCPSITSTPLRRALELVQPLPDGSLERFAAFIRTRPEIPEAAQ